MRNFLDNSIVEHKSRPPLRWIANWAGSIASSGILKVAYIEEDVMEEKATFGFRYKFYGWLWDTFWPIYEKYGTFYKLDTDLSGSGWDDYDENGVPYWEKTGVVDPEFDPDLNCICSNCDENEHCPGCVECEPDFEDEETGDAFRIL